MEYGMSGKCDDDIRRDPLVAEARRLFSGKRAKGKRSPVESFVRGMKPKGNATVASEQSKTIRIKSGMKPIAMSALARERDAA